MQKASHMASLYFLCSGKTTKGETRGCQKRKSSLQRQALQTTPVMSMREPRQFMVTLPVQRTPMNKGRPETFMGQYSWGSPRPSHNGSSAGGVALRIKPDCFDGIKTEWPEYKKHFNFLASLQRWTDMQKAQALAVSLSGSAQSMLIGMTEAETRSYLGSVPGSQIRPCGVRDCPPG